jgi:ABC-type glycerol-3-phosphate transport system substrate-binding protein
MAGTVFAGCGDTSSDSSSDAGTTAAADSNDDSAADDASSDDAASDDASADDTSSDDTAASADVELTDDGDKLTIMCWTGSDLDPMIKLFCENTDYTEDQITWVQVGTSGSEANEQYEQYFMGSEDADLFVAEADWILKYINMDEYAAPLSALGIDESAYSDAYPYTVAIGKDNNGVLKGASWQAAAGGYVYRTDLAEQYLNVTSPDEMQALIGDWDGFQSAAATVSELSDGQTAMAATIGGLWQVFAANRNEPWVKDNKLVLDNAADFVDMVKTMSDNNYVTGVSQWNDAWYQLGQDGSTMGYFFSTWCLTNAEGGQLYQAEGGVDGPTYGLYNICVGPTNYFWGGSWLVPTTRCNNKTMAADFVNFFTTNAETMQQYAESSGDFVNSKTAMQNIVDAGTNSNALLGGQDQFSVLIDAASGIQMDGLITEYDSTIKSNFIDAVNNYVAGSYASTDETIEAFEDSVAASYPSLDWDE